MVAVANVFIFLTRSTKPKPYVDISKYVMSKFRYLLIITQNAWADLRLVQYATSTTKIIKKSHISFEMSLNRLDQG